MIRVVIDTNVVVSATLTLSGPPFHIIELASHQVIQLMSPFGETTISKSSGENFR